MNQIAKKQGPCGRASLSVVVPCYNEEKSLEEIVQRFAQANPGKNGFELVLVDNGSSDGTWQSLLRLCRVYQFVKRVRVEKNVGYGFGIMSGLATAKGEFLCWTHADLQTDPLDAVKAYELTSASPSPVGCFVKGRRKNRPMLDAFFAFGMSAFAALVLGRWLEDINAQPNLFHRSFLISLKSAPKDFSFDLYALFKARQSGLQIVRFPVDFSRRIHGRSHWNEGIFGKWKFIKRTALFVLELRSRLSEER